MRSAALGVPRRLFDVCVCARVFRVFKRVCVWRVGWGGAHAHVCVRACVRVCVDGGWCAALSDPLHPSPGSRSY